MNNNQEKLIEKLLELCDSIISEAYVVTNGLKVSAVVLDESVAKFLCKEMRKKYGSDRWTMLNIPQAIEYAFSSGREYAFEEINGAKNRIAEQPVDASVKGEGNGESRENQELRERGVQQEEQSD